MATIKYWDGSAWQYAVVGKQGPVGATGPTGPAGSASLQRFRFVATGGETSLSGTDANGNTLAYTSGLEEVFLNGAALVRGQDYTATNGTSITGLTALVASDVVEILAWGVFNVSNTISNTLVDAKGDLLVGSAADTVSRLAVGSANQVLTVDSSTATGLKWDTPASGGMTLISTTTINNDAQITLSSISGSYNHLQVVIRDYRPATDTAALQCRINADSNTRYITSNTNSNTNASFGNSALSITLDSDNGASDSSAIVDFFDYANATTYKLAKVFSVVNNPTTTTNAAYQERYGIYNQTGAITSLVFLAETGNMTSGTILLYGVK